MIRVPRFFLVVAFAPAIFAAEPGELADLTLKEVHAGHLFAARISPNQVLLQDLKTGQMNLKTREARLANSLSDEQKAALKEKQKPFPNKLASEGIAHPTKKTLRLSVPRNAVVDDLKIWRKG